MFFNILIFKGLKHLFAYCNKPNTTALRVFIFVFSCAAFFGLSSACRTEIFKIVLRSFHL